MRYPAELGAVKGEIRHTTVAQSPNGLPPASLDNWGRERVAPAARRR